MKSTAPRLPAIALLVAIALLPGCRKAQDNAVAQALERATGAKVDKDGDTVTVKTDKGELKVATAENGGSVALPAGFPSDIYLPADNKVASAMDMAGVQMVNLTTPRPLAQVSGEVEETMQAQGWKREMAMQADGGNTLMYSKDKRQVVYQLLKGEAGGTQLAIRTGPAG
ncbi:MAG: hypothetical protein EOP39_22580 [Rubrivivax sp.]|nr:MAG: hypothetical protein EOP39_22580 [Rubrivivax sp.]